jgi:hypothetical protein
MNWPKIRWGWKTTATNSRGREIVSYWYGLSWGVLFLGLLVWVIDKKELSS